MKSLSGPFDIPAGDAGRRALLAVAGDAGGEGAVGPIDGVGDFVVAGLAEGAGTKPLMEVLKEPEQHHSTTVTSLRCFCTTRPTPQPPLKPPHTGIHTMVFSARKF